MHTGGGSTGVRFLADSTTLTALLCLQFLPLQRTCLFKRSMIEHTLSQARCATKAMVARRTLNAERISANLRGSQHFMHDAKTLIF